MRQIALDTETTGLSPKAGHKIIEIGCVEIINRQITGEAFHVYCNPEREVEEGAQNVHGISSEFLQDKPLFSSVADDLLSFIKDAEIIIHNAPFDVGFLEHELSLMKSSIKQLDKHCHVTDTLIMARQMHPGQRNSLDALCKRYHVNNSSRSFHGALLDAELLAQVYLAMTGGQTTLFAEKKDNLLVQSEKKSSQIKEFEDTPLQKASEEEDALHQQLLRSMAKKDTCLWHQLDGVSNEDS